MKKSILNLGKALNKAEQKEINGGISRKEFCATKKMILLGDYQGDLNYGFNSFYRHCGRYGYTLN
ncbi:hypothetical protein [Tenacibaculum soleae]|uniref:hypothetical protein n=1 Tax=Tenacibaculum soleae TaxID=447689 RepID=UPI0026E2D36D|nr:hypothetical protein [Tenacibaculum soleae]MDO6811928.1 hypothetical protein [Tenacibaculum soleae]